jgi:hypothetical protein
MMISDLSHFEEVVVEAPNIVGGGIISTSSRLQLKKKIDEVRAQLKKNRAAIRSEIEKSKIEVASVNLQKNDASATATIASGTTAQGKVEVSTSSSSAQS